MKWTTVCVERSLNITLSRLRNGMGLRTSLSLMGLHILLDQPQLGIPLLKNHHGPTIGSV